MSPSFSELPSGTGRHNGTVVDRFESDSFSHNVSDAEVSLPANIKSDGLYRIVLSRAAMTETKALAYCEQQVLYDRATGVAVDISKAAALPAVSTQEQAIGELLPEGEIAQLDSWLTGKSKPQYERTFPRGVKRFEVHELDRTATETLREVLSELYDYRHSVARTERTLLEALSAAVKRGQ